MVAIRVFGTDKFHEETVKSVDLYDGIHLGEAFKLELYNPLKIYDLSGD